MFLPYLLFFTVNTKFYSQVRIRDTNAFFSRRTSLVIYYWTEETLGRLWSGATTSLWDASFLRQLKPKRSVDLCLTSHDSLKGFPLWTWRNFMMQVKMSSLLNDWFMSSFRHGHSATPYEFQAQFGWPPFKSFITFIYGKQRTNAAFETSLLCACSLLLTWYCVTNVFIFPSNPCPYIP